jgi:hypothetical protein
MNLTRRNSIIFAIGIDKYESSVWPELKNAVRDAKTVVELLVKRYGFEAYPDPLYNEKANRKAILEALSTLREYSREDDNVLIYYAGHGQMHPSSGRGYWIPSDANNGVYSFIDNAIIKDFVHDIIAQHILLISDSCFSGTFLSRTRGPKTEVKYCELDALKSRWMFASGREEKVSDGAEGEHSPFSRFLISYLKANNNKYTSAKEIIGYIAVMTPTVSKQSPYGSHFESVGDQGGEMLFMLEDEYVIQNIETTSGRTSTQSLANQQLLHTPRNKSFAAGKDVLLTYTFTGKEDYAVMELFRFNDDGTKRISFKGNQVIFKGGDTHLEVVQRFSSRTGLMRYIDENGDLFKDKSIAIMPVSEEIDNVESEAYVQIHAAYLEELLSFNKDATTCLHCGEKIVEPKFYTVEIDEKGLKDMVGSVHFSCVRPVNRILGIAGYENSFDMSLLTFDPVNWHTLLEKGHGQLAGYKKSIAGPAIFLWNSENHINVGNYCIRIHYEDGYTSFVHKGKDIHRFRDEEIDKEIERFDQSIRGKEEDDVSARIVESNLYGTVKQLKKLLKSGEIISLVKKHEKVRYSKLFETTSTKLDNDYTPLGYLLDATSGEKVIINNIIPVLSEPLRFAEFHSNWLASGINIGPCKLIVIQSDIELDLYVKLFATEDLEMVIDPLFSDSQDLISGLIIRDHTFELKYPEIATWKQGDFALLSIKGHKGPHPTGIIQSEVFIEEGTLYVIWQPLEGGIPLDEMFYKVPIERLNKIEKSIQK